MKVLWSLFVLIIVVAGGLVFYRYLQAAEKERLAVVIQLRDRDRREHLRTLASAIKQYIVDHNGQLPGNVYENNKFICRTDIESDCMGLVDLSKLTDDYLVTLPIDPLVLTGASTGYSIRKERDLITVEATQAEKEDISISF